MKGLIARLKKMDALAILLVILLVFILVLILTASGTINIFGNDENLPIGTIQQETDEDFVEEPELKASDFPGSEELLSALPYNSNDFIVNYLPLEEDAPPKIVVYFLTPDSEAKFKNWLEHFRYESDVQFIYQKDEVIDPENSGY